MARRRPAEFRLLELLGWEACDAPPLADFALDAHSADLAWFREEETPAAAQAYLDALNAVREGLQDFAAAEDRLPCGRLPCSRCGSRPEHVVYHPDFAARLCEPCFADFLAAAHPAEDDAE